METLSKILESRLIIKLRPTPNRPVLPLLAGLCSGGVFAAEFPMDNPLSLDAIKSGCSLFPDLVLGVGGVLSVSGGKKAIAAGARYLSSPGYSPAIAKLCKEQEVLYLPQCMTPSELLAVRSDGLSAAFLFAPHLWGRSELIDAVIDAFPKMTFMASDLSSATVPMLHTHPRLAAASISGLETSTPESLVDLCHQIALSIDSTDS